MKEAGICLRFSVPSVVWYGTGFVVCARNLSMVWGGWRWSNIIFIYDYKQQRRTKMKPVQMCFV